MQDDLDELIAQAFESAVDRAGFGDYVWRLSRHFGADGGSILAWNAREPGAALYPVSHALPDTAIQDCFNQRGQPGNLFATLSAAIPAETIRADADHNRLTRQCPGHLLATVASHDDPMHCAILLLRSGDRAAFGDAEALQLGRLAAFLGRALAINEHFIRTLCELRTTRLLIDRASRGILLIGQNGQITYSNRLADEIVSRGDGLRIAEQQLIVDDPESRQRIDRFFAALQTNLRTGQTGDACSFSLRIPRQDPNRLPYQMLVYGLPGDAMQARLDDSQGLAAVVLHDPEREPGLSQEVLTTYFRLSPAEARLARALLVEHTIPAASAVIGISTNTARSQLKSIFEKVGVRSQQALMQRLSFTLSPVEPEQRKSDNGPQAPASAAHPVWLAPGLKIPGLRPIKPK